MHVHAESSACTGCPVRGGVHRLTRATSGLERFSIRGLDPVVGTNINHYRTPITHPHEVVQHVPPDPAVVAPSQRKWLGRNTGHIHIGVERDQMIPLQPRLVTDMLTGRGEPPPPRKLL